MYRPMSSMLRKPFSCLLAPSGAVLTRRSGSTQGPGAAGKPLSRPADDMPGLLPTALATVVPPGTWYCWYCMPQRSAMRY